MGGGLNWVYKNCHCNRAVCHIIFMPVHMKMLVARLLYFNIFLFAEPKNTYHCGQEPWSFYLGSVSQYAEAPHQAAIIFKRRDKSMFPPHRRVSAAIQLSCISVGRSTWSNVLWVKSDLFSSTSLCLPECTADVICVWDWQLPFCEVKAFCNATCQSSCPHQSFVKLHPFRPPYILQ